MCPYYACISWNTALRVTPAVHILGMRCLLLPANLVRTTDLGILHSYPDIWISELLFSIIYIPVAISDVIILLRVRFTNDLFVI